MLKTLHGLTLGLACLLAVFGMRQAAADVIVSVEGNVATAQILLEDGGGNYYQAEVTITFDSPLNLSAQSLNLTATLVNPSDPIVTSRLPGNLTIDSAFPMMITVEPPNIPWLFTSGFDGNEDGTGNLSFLNVYEIEIHTHDILYTDASPYRLIKAPVGGNFLDYTDDIWPGSTRARGRDGAFSQFMIAKDSYTNGLSMLLFVAVPKLLNLQVRVIAAALDDVLNLDLLGLLADIAADLTILGLDIGGAIDALDQLIATVIANAGITIPNEWNSEHSVTNDAGEILGLAQTLRFTLVRLQSLPIL